MGAILAWRPGHCCPVFRAVLAVLDELRQCLVSLGLHLTLGTQAAISSSGDSRTRPCRSSLRPHSDVPSSGRDIFLDIYQPLATLITTKLAYLFVCLLASDVSSYQGKVHERWDCSLFRSPYTLDTWQRTWARGTQYLPFE